MKALVLHGPRTLRHETVADPRLRAPTDVLLRVTATAVGASDLRIYHTLDPRSAPLIMGQEFTGIVEEVGAAVRGLRPGDRVFVPVPVACGSCWYCDNDMADHCDAARDDVSDAARDDVNGADDDDVHHSGVLLGGHAERVRVPFGDTGPRRIPDGVDDDEALLLSHALPTAWAAIDWGNPRGGESVVVVGCGPVGLLAMKSARLRGAARIIAVDRSPWRLHHARAIGACDDALDASDASDDVVDVIHERTSGGADIVVDATSAEAHRSPVRRVGNVVHLQLGSMHALRTCMAVVRPGGTVSVVGERPLPSAGFPFSRLATSGVSLRMGKAPVHAYLDLLVDLVRRRQLSLADVISHHLPLAEGAAGFEMFSRQDEGCSKIVLRP